MINKSLQLFQYHLVNESKYVAIDKAMKGIRGKKKRFQKRRAHIYPKHKTAA